MSFNSSKINITFNQKNIYMTDKLNGNSKVNNIFGIININKEFDLNKIIKLINKIIENNDALRINIIEENNDLYQVINEYKYEEIDSVEISKEDNVDKIIEDFSNDVIDINDKVLYKFKIINIENNKGIILVKLHHIISDAWSFSKIAEQFIEMYENNELSQENKMSFYDYTLKEEEYLQSKKYQKDEEFFNEYLDGIQEKVSFKEADSRVETYEASRYQIKLDEDLNNKINEFCKENKISSYVLFLTMLSVYMYRTLDKNDFVIGTPVLGRSNFAEKQIVGMFVSTIPLRIKIAENMSVLELAKNISMDLMKIFRHQKYPYLKMLKNVHKNTEIKNNLYDVILSFQNARINNNYDNKYTTTWNFSEAMYDEMQIHIVDMDNTGTLAINYDYLKSHFEEIEIEYLHKRFVTMIEQFIRLSDISVEDIDILCQRDKESINSINNTYLKIDYKQTPINMFRIQLVKNSDKIALVCNENKYTYKELDEITNRFANFLISKGLKKSDVVGIMLSRNENVVISMLACSKIGVAYVPIDVRFPKQRIEYILNNSKCKYIITDEQREFEAQTIIFNSLDYLKYTNEEVNYLQDENDICYLIYTSGSTGSPKGVMISNKNLTNFLIGINNEFKLNSKDNLLSITTISFDIYELEMWLTLVNGATLCLANDNECINEKLLNEFCVKNNVNVLQTTPTKLRMLLNQDSEKNYLENLEKVLIGGECLDENLYNKIKENTNLRIFDVYGPTETTVWSTIKDITNSKISAGKPISNTKIFILDKRRRILPMFTKGELAISGDSVSCGYFENESKTNKAFVNVDFQKDIVYLTGDLALINSNQDLEILNRIDNQIKINGQRIELEEIESLILDNDNISDTAISYRDKKYLVCFYSLKDISKDINLNEVKEKLKNKLPIYMVPQIFIKLDKLPYTLNNKKDRKKINEILISNIEVKNTNKYKILKDDEKYINIIKEVCKQDEVEKIVLDSLQVIEISLKLKEKFDINLSPIEILQNNNVFGILDSIKNNKSKLKIKNNDNIDKIYEKYPLTKAQQDIIVEYFNNKNSNKYNICFEVVFSENYDKDKLNKVLNKIVNKYYVFKNNMIFKNGIFYQQPNNKKIKINCENIKLEDYLEVKKQFNLPLELLSGESFYIKHYHVENKNYILFNIHHVFFDGISVKLFIEEIINLYNNNKFINKNVYLGNVAINELEYSKTQEYLNNKEYYLNRFRDYDDSNKTNFLDNINYSKKEFEIDSKTYTILKEFAKLNSFTINTVLFTLFIISAIKMKEKYNFPVAVFNSDRKELNTYGMFVNTLPFLVTYNNEKSFLEYCRIIHNTLFEDIKNSKFRISDLNKELRKDGKEINLDLSYTFQNMYQFENIINENKIEFNSLNGNLKFNFNFEVHPMEKDCKIILEYNNCKYNEDIILKFIDEFLEKIKRLPENFDLNLKFDNKNNNVISNIENKSQNLTDINSEQYNKVFELFKKVLNNQNIIPQDDFFEVGGDSMLAIQLIAIALENNVNLKYNDIFKYKIIDNIIKASLQESEENVTYDKDVENYDYSKFDQILNKKEDFNYKKIEMKNVFIVGVTGFLGIHVLDSYLRKSKGIAYCLVRSKNNINAFERLKNIIIDFFGVEYYEKYNDRIKVIEGDLTYQNVILNNTDKQDIIKNVESIINVAAIVKHYGNKDIFYDINLYGTQKIIEFCNLYKKKLVHISTISVSGNMLEASQLSQEKILESTDFDETKLYINQNLDNIYIYTKFLAEREILEAITNGLDAKIIRVGNLTGRYSDGKFQTNIEENAFIGRLLSFAKIGYIPKELTNFYLEFSPVDLTADAIIEICKMNIDRNVFHVYNNKHVEIDKFLNIIDKYGININIVSSEEMKKILKANIDKKSADINGILYDINEKMEFMYQNNIKIKGDFTNQILEKSGFIWKEIDEQYIYKFLIKIGIIEEGKNGI